MKNLFIYMSVVILALTGSFAYAEGPVYIGEWPAGPWPLGIDVDNEGRIWVSNYGDNTVSCFTNIGSIVATYETPWSHPYGIAASSVVYAGSDFYGVSTNDACDPPEQFCVFKGELTNSHGVALDRDNKIYVATTPGIIFKFDQDGTQEAMFNYAGQDVAVDQTDNIFVLYDHDIIKLAPDGTELQRWDGSETPAGRLSAAEGLGLDRFGNVYVADTYNNRVVVFNGSGVCLTYWGTFGTGPGEFRQVEDVTVDDSGCIYVTDAFNGRIQKFGYATSAVPGWNAPPTLALSIAPNPINSTSILRFSLPSARSVTLGVYDLAGRLIAMPYENRQFDAGAHDVAYSPRTSGIYFLRFTAGNQTSTQKLIVVR
ncbi:MAG: T9SS type A sorting domain-containing protein [Patescibacteria group bacterium]